MLSLLALMVIVALLLGSISHGNSSDGQVEGASFSYGPSVRSALRAVYAQRNDAIRQFIGRYGMEYRPKNCPQDRYLVFEGDPYGQTGNNHITLMHALWYAKQANRTFVIPEWLNYVLLPFNLTTLHEVSQIDLLAGRLASGVRRETTSSAHY
jgi:hypothetical protein